MLTLGRVLLTLAVLGTATSTLCTFPHQLAYFNELAEATENGVEHLCGSNAEWGPEFWGQWRQPAEMRLPK